MTIRNNRTNKGLNYILYNSMFYSYIEVGYPLILISKIYLKNLALTSKDTPFPKKKKKISYRYSLLGKIDKNENQGMF